ncbi:hypothetical protein, partial [Rhizobium sp. Leaf371]|uniref:hypothetical protein n=1 Tax=Rhizobium sp. Leaf371 TaxID=1736355 RepID=UPI001AEBC4B2
TSIGEMIVAHDIRHGHKANHQIRADGLRRRHTMERADLHLLLKVTGHLELADFESWLAAIADAT